MQLFKWFKKPKSKPKITKKTEITLTSTNQINHNKFMVYLIIGKQGYGKTTLSQKLQIVLSNKLRKPIITVKTIDDLDNENSILVIDDLKTEITKEVMHKLTDILRISRHKNLTIILTHHLLSQIPTQLIQLSSKLILFNCSFNAVQNSKLLNVISKAKLTKLHELTLSLEKFQYVIVQTNKIYGVYANDNVNPIISEKPDKEINLNETAEKPENQENEKDILTIVKAMIPEFEYLTLTQQIIALQKTFPKMKPKQIALALNTTPQTVRTKIYQHKHGLL